MRLIHMCHIFCRAVARAIHAAVSNQSSDGPYDLARFVVRLGTSAYEEVDFILKLMTDTQYREFETHYAALVNSDDAMDTEEDAEGISRRRDPSPQDCNSRDPKRVRIQSGRAVPLIESERLPTQ